eukprot:3126162-Rhodomonas_salina.4
MVKQIKAPEEEEVDDPLSQFTRWWSKTVAGDEEQVRAPSCSKCHPTRRQMVIFACLVSHHFTLTRLTPRGCPQHTQMHIADDVEGPPVDDVISTSGPSVCVFRY